MESASDFSENDQPFNEFQIYLDSEASGETVRKENTFLFDEGLFNDKMVGMRKKLFGGA
jgi:hypothetical protein